jgi:hypothetical protein
MTVARDTTIQHALINAGLDPQAQKRLVEQQIRKAEQKHNLFLEKAARRDIDIYLNSQIYPGTKAEPMSILQLSLNFEKIGGPMGLEIAPS